jgi:surface polysaccharide O-acyltransferase-like enzyme
MQIRQDIEALKLASALGIVWFHSGAEGAGIGYSGLVAFLILSVFLSGHTSGVNAGARARRLLVPWLVWAALYGFLRFVRRQPVISLKNGLAAGILSGPSIHLWYLPFIFMVLVALDVAKTRVSLSLLCYSGAILAVLTFISSGEWIGASLRAGYPWAQYSYAAAGIFTGMYLMGVRAINRQHRIPLLLLILLSAAAAIPLSGIGLSYLIGIAACAPVLLSPAPMLAVDIRPVSQCSFGIYLIHPLILMVANGLKVNIGMLLPVIVFFLSGLLVWYFRRSFPGAAKYAF